MREATTFSRILEMKLRLEIGRKLLRSSVDRDGFLRRGWTRACLNDDGKIPSERERLTIIHAFRPLAGVWLPAIAFQHRVLVSPMVSPPAVRLRPPNMAASCNACRQTKRI